MTKQNNSIQTKNAFFFSHDSNARNDEKIINLRMKHGAEGYGVYFMLVEMLMEATDYMLATNYLALAFNLRTNDEVVRSVIEDFELFDFTEDIEFFYSASLNKRLKPLEQLREQRRLAGIRSGEVRRAKAAEKVHSEVLEERVMNECSTNDAPRTNRGEESREEKSRVEQSRADEAEVAEAPSKAKADRFVPPTPQVLESYCIVNKYDIDTNTFLDFYQSKGWMVGRNKMKDWQAAVRNWVRTDANAAQKRRYGLSAMRVPNIANHKNDKAYEQF